MVRSTGFARSLRMLQAWSIGATFVIAVVSCSDSTTAPNGFVGDPASGAFSVAAFHYSDSLKRATAIANASAVSPSDGAASSVRGTNEMSSVLAVPTYSVFPVAFVPEVMPATATKLSAQDDAINNNIGIGFTFKFFANNYNIVHISSNGFLGFTNSIRDGFAGGTIPNALDAPYNNLIALAWTDLNPSAAGASYSYALIGTSPNRKFVVQWSNVPEYDLGSNPIAGKMPASPPGHVTGQIVLSETSNDITLYTAYNDITSSFHPVTQGIENSSGTEAAFLDGRVQAHFVTPLVNDGVRFSFSHINQPPVVVAPPNLTVNTDAGVCSSSVKPGSPTVSDDAPGATVTGVRNDGLALDAAYPARVTTIDWTATDVGGLTGHAASVVTVSDKEAPSLHAPDAVSTVTDRGLNTATVLLSAPVASDNCGSVTVVGSRSDAKPLSSGFPVGETIVTWKATDVAGNSSSVTQSINVSGNQPPVIASAPDIDANTDASVCTANVSPSPVVTDDADGVVLTGVRSDGRKVSDPYPKGLTTIAWTAKDAGGLTANATQKVKIRDREKPSITAPANKSENNTGFAMATISVGTASAADNCITVTVEGKRSDGASLSAPYPIGTTTITWSAVDGSQNSNSATQTVTIADMAPPTIDVPAAMIVNATLPSGAAVDYKVNASDNVGVDYFMCSPATGSMFAIGKTTVGCTARDGAGNQATASFDVTVLGAQDQIGNLIAKISAMDLQPGVANPLLAQLNTAYRSPGNGSHVACVKMGDFIKLFEGPKSRFPMTKAQAQVVDDARRIMAVLGC
ncbi:MAG: HYR domain-containing protein [Gemmatimonadaceae bacterium]